MRFDVAVHRGAACVSFFFLTYPHPYRIRFDNRVNHRHRLLGGSRQERRIAATCLFMYVRRIAGGHYRLVSVTVVMVVC